MRKLGISIDIRFLWSFLSQVLHNNTWSMNCLSFFPGFVLVWLLNIIFFALIGRIYFTLFWIFLNFSRFYHFRLAMFRIFRIIFFWVLFWIFEVLVFKIILSKVIFLKIFTFLAWITFFRFFHRLMIRYSSFTSKEGPQGSHFFKFVELGFMLFAFFEITNLFV